MPLDTPAWLSKMRRLTASGYSYRQMAAKLGVAKSTLHDAAAAHDLPRPAPRRLTPLQRRDILRRLDQGEGIGAIARAVGVAKSTVSVLGRPHHQLLRKLRASPDDTPLAIETYKALLVAGKSLREASELLGKPRSTLHGWARQHLLPLRSTRLSPEQRRTIERLLREARLSVTEIAQELGIAKSTVSNARREWLDRGLKVKVVNLKKARRCELHGLIMTRQCLICLAEEERRRLGKSL